MKGLGASWEPLRRPPGPVGHLFFSKLSWDYWDNHPTTKVDVMKHLVSVHTVHDATILICDLIFGSILISVLKNYIVLIYQGWLNYLFTGRSLYPTENKNGTDNGTIITKQYLVSDLVGFFRMKTIQFPQNMTCLVCTEITNACNTSST